MSSEPSTKRQRTTPQYTLLYHPGIPGRGEFIRLALEATGTAYTDLAMEQPDGYAEVQRVCMGTATLASEAGNPPVFAPPALRVQGAGEGEGRLVISQTANILSYLGERIGMAGDGGEGVKYHVAQLAQTALDLNNEVHDSHHPVGVSLYYEDQKAESLRKSKDVRENRLPKFFGYFARTLKFNASEGRKGGGRFMVGAGLTYADTTVWQVLDGLFFAFPNEMKARKEEFPELLGTFYEGVKGEKGIKEYLASGRRMEYSMGVFRHYPELDRQE